MKSNISYMKYLVIMLAMLMLSGCVMPKMQIEDIKEVAPDETVFIGRIMMSPPLSKDEIEIRNTINLSDIELHKVLYLKASDVYYTLEGYHATDYKDSVVTEDGKYYYFTWKKNQPLHLLGVSFMTRMTSTNRDYMTFAIGKGMTVKHSGKSKAVYVGDIVFVRDEFFNIKDIKIKQGDYKNAVNAFRKKYKARWKVEKAKLQMKQ